MAGRGQTRGCELGGGHRESRAQCYQEDMCGASRDIQERRNGFTRITLGVPGREVLDTDLGLGLEFRGRLVGLANIPQ